MSEDTTIHACPVRIPATPTIGDAIKRIAIKGMIFLKKFFIGMMFFAKITKKSHKDVEKC